MDFSGIFFSLSKQRKFDFSECVVGGECRLFIVQVWGKLNFYFIAIKQEIKRTVAATCEFVFYGVRSLCYSAWNNNKVNKPTHIEYVHVSLYV